MRANALRLVATALVLAGLSATTPAQQPQVPASPLESSGETSQPERVIQPGRLIGVTSTASGAQ